VKNTSFSIVGEYYPPWIKKNYPIGMLVDFFSPFLVTQMSRIDWRRRRKNESFLSSLAKVLLFS